MDISDVARARRLCRYVCVVAGTSEGLLWECRMLSEARALAKVVVLPPDHGQLEAAWRTSSAASSQLSEPLIPGSDGRPGHVPPGNGGLVADVVRGQPGLG